MHQQQEWERGNWGGGAQGSYREEASSHCVGIPKVSHGHGWPLASRCVPSILPGAGWKVEVNLPLANGAAAELDVVMLETVSRRKDVMVKGVVRGTSDRRASASLSAPQPDDSTTTPRGTARQRVEEEASWRAAATRAGRGRTGDGETMRRRAEEAG